MSDDPSRLPLPETGPGAGHAHGVPGSWAPIPKLTTMQEVFDFVVTRLGIQGRRSYSMGRGPDEEAGGCRYRGPRGCRCAIGHIEEDGPDGSSFATVEGLRIRAMIRRHDAGRYVPNVLDLLNRGVVTRAFLHDLQNAHDNACGTAAEAVAWFRSVAEEHELDDAVVAALRVWAG